MDRSEFMRLKGELVTASELLQQANADLRSCKEALQSFVNALTSRKMTPEYADQGTALLAKMLGLQQQADFQAAQVSLYQHALDGVPVPPA